MDLPPTALSVPLALPILLPPGPAYPLWSEVKGSSTSMDCGEAGPRPLHPLPEAEGEKSLSGGAAWKERKAITFLLLTNEG